MILLDKRRILAFVLCCCSFLGVISVVWAGVALPAQTTFLPQIENQQVTWVIDAGHGGEDGGAISSTGINESDINLEIALRLNDMLRFAGEATSMIRSTEAAVHTEGDTIRARKASDIRNRVSHVEKTEGAVLVSIHQNSLPSSPVTYGAQVFWNQQEGGEALAYVVQDTLNAAINIGNEKQAKKIPNTIYLMKHISAPAILVECGFLSNLEETERLKDGSYQKKLTAAISAGCLQALTERND